MFRMGIERKLLQAGVLGLSLLLPSQVNGGTNPDRNLSVLTQNIVGRNGVSLNMIRKPSVGDIIHTYMKKLDANSLSICAYHMKGFPVFSSGTGIEADTKRNAYRFEFKLPIPEGGRLVYVYNIFETRNPLKPVFIVGKLRNIDPTNGIDEEVYSARLTYVCDFIN